MTGLADVGLSAENMEVVLAYVLHEMAREEAPRLFALVEEYGCGEDVRVAGYGLAYEDRADVNSVEGDLQLHAQSAESVRTLFEASSRSAGVRRVHVVWLGEAAATAQQR
jgi:hypothetical protein